MEICHDVGKTVATLKTSGPYTLQDIAFLGAVEKLPQEMTLSEDCVVRMMIANHLKTSVEGLSVTASAVF